MELKSVNFEPLRPAWPDLAGLGAFAERYVHNDPSSAAIKMRTLIERMVDGIYRRTRFPKPLQPTLMDLLKNEPFEAAVPKVVLDKFHLVRKGGNRAAHGTPPSSAEALLLLRQCYDLSRWYYVGVERKKIDAGDAAETVRQKHAW